MTTFSPQEFERAMDEAGEALFDQIRARFRVYGEEFTGTMVRERLTGRPGLIRRTGSLARSFGWTETGDTPATWRGIHYTTSPYAPTHEFGATITPKTAKKLAIPLDAVKTPAGVPRGGPRSFPDAFVVKSKAGNLLLARRKGDGIEPLFVLKDSVRVPARLEYFDTWDRDDDKRGEVLAAATEAALEGL